MDNQAILKKRIQPLLKDSLYCINNEDLFLNMPVIADCVKSLIGTNLDNPYTELIDWLENRVGELEKKRDTVASKNKEIKTTSYKQLQGSSY